jgi:hypothetical protein
MPGIYVRVPEPVFEQLKTEAERRAQDLATTVRRHIQAGMSRDDIDARLEEIANGLERTATNESVKLLADTVTAVGKRIEDLITLEKKLTANFDRLVDHYNGLFEKVAKLLPDEVAK